MVVVVVVTAEIMGVNSGDRTILVAAIVAVVDAVVVVTVIVVIILIE